MATGSTVARRWAEALFEAAGAAGATAEVGQDLGDAARALWGDERVRGFILSDRVSQEAKKNLVRDLGVHRLARNFLALAIDKRREAYIPEIARTYAALADKAAGIVDVRVRTAVELGEPGRKNLVSVLERKLGRGVRVSFAVDPSLLGGLQLRVEDRLFDASLARRLERLGEHLAKARVGVE